MLIKYKKMLGFMIIVTPSRRLGVTGIFGFGPSPYTRGMSVCVSVCLSVCPSVTLFVVTYLLLDRWCYHDMPHTKRKPWHCRWFRNQERAEIPPGSAPKLSFSEPTPKNAPKIDTWHGISQPIFGVGKSSAPQKMRNHMPNKYYFMVLGRFWPFKVRKVQKTVKIWRFCHV